MENNTENLKSQIVTSSLEIKNLIYNIRGKQVMLDSDVAMLYHYETKYINLAVKRNKDRFPENFCFQLTEEEFDFLRLQIATLNGNGRGHHKKYLPFVFTEHGITMLAGLLKNKVAIDISIKIVNSFVEMRKFIANNGQIFERLTNIEYKLLDYDKKFDEVFNQLQHEDNFKQKIFFQGQIWEGYSLIIDIIKTAKEKILVIDNYIDDSILKMLCKKNRNVEVIILTSNRSNISDLDIQKFNREYPTLKLAKTNRFHDRFIVVDNKVIYHCGASLKDLGKKCFAINKIEDMDSLNKLSKVI
ncbi:MAG: ORF6N domain-containing protein [Clostridia bacterium]|nr:ORF6N domain-containing protein [Clostridia bacterium]